MQFSPEALNVVGPLIVLGPLFAAAVAGLLQRYIGDKIAMGITTFSVGLSLALSLPIFADFVWGEGHEQLIELFRFIDVAGFTSTWSVRIDALSARHVLAAMGPDTIAVIPPSCMAIIAGAQPLSGLRIPVYQPTLESSAAAASGLKRALVAQGKPDTQVLVLAGDGGTYDIGFQCLSSAAERNEDFVYVCLDNEGYGRSDKHRPINCDIANGADDLDVASQHVLKTTQAGNLLVYGISSGALKAALWLVGKPAGRYTMADVLGLD